MATMKECPVCGIRVKLENLEGHLKKVHPNAKVDSVLSEDDKADIKIAKKKQMKTGAPFEDAERRRWAIGAIIIAIIISVILILVAFPPPANDGGVVIGEQAPPFKYSDVDNVPYDLNLHIGNHLILLEFFYTECIYCLQIHPNLEELYTYYGNGARVEFVSISGDPLDSFEDVRNYRDMHGSAWPFIDAPESLTDTWGVTATPTMFLIGTDGTVIKKIVGYKTVEQLKGEINPHL
ncbi:MAG: TlpA disulfide reductase family protein [Thermoplasmata archaeon]